MPIEIIIGLATYLFVISTISVALCLYDKLASKIAKRLRTREAVLLGLSALGGSLAMFVTMLLTNHKTKHLKFMLGIPFIMVLQIGAIITLSVIFRPFFG